MEYKNYIVEITEIENGYDYTGEWNSDFYQDVIEATDEEGAIDFAKARLEDMNVNVDDYLFRAKGVR